jgi:hypothetical protein
MKNNIHLGNSMLKHSREEIQGSFKEIGGELYYTISAYDQMPDFFMTIVSNSDHWMFLSSTGSLTAGRKNRDNALFPYYTVDKIHESKGKTGSKTSVLVEKDNKKFLWEPFTDNAGMFYNLSRSLSKSVYGNKIIFQEINHDLGLKFSYGWYNSERFGWIKKANIENLSENSTKISLLDGVTNILPYGINYHFQNEYSNLSNAYKKNELLSQSKLGLFMLSSIPVDKAEPSESLKTTTVWSVGLGNSARFLISERQVNNFNLGMSVKEELDVRAEKGAYYVQSDFKLNKEEQKEWFFALEINQDATDVANLDHFILHEKDLTGQLLLDIHKGTDLLRKIVGSADGNQQSGKIVSMARHFSNTLFNIMRGGVFENNYTIDLYDFIKYSAQTNIRVFKKYEYEFEALKEMPLNYERLINWAESKNDRDLLRICQEYLPLIFSRRHGDPSRPWNQFSIELKNEDGSKKHSYEGNWRDIFQNWEALALSFPGFVDSMICKFLNATTPDGYNPYRITRDGIDWESPDPDDPWAYIGYWGDHQIIYLQKLLELSTQYHPERLQKWEEQDFFVYANVPYRIKDFKELVKDPKNTIDFDHDLNGKLNDLAEQIGADGKLLRNGEGKLIYANYYEKLLVTLLAKLSNFIPDAGIWLNTQRPEWNDANNALVGNGVSMVTLYYLRRFINFWIHHLDQSKNEISLAVEINDHFKNSYNSFLRHQDHLESGFSDQERFELTKEQGEAGSAYRNSIYNNGFTGEKTKLRIADLKSYLSLVLKYIDQSIRKNQRSDGLYHAYNLVSFPGRFDQHQVLI